MKIGDKIRYCVDYYHDNTVYTVIGLDEDGGPTFVDEDGNEDLDYAHKFEVVSPFNDFDKAHSLIGKDVMYNGKPFKVEAVTVYNKYHPTNNKTITKEVREFGHSIVLENDNGSAPLSEVEEISNRVVLNDEYTAIIDGETVKVGCQTIPIKKVEEILKTFKKLNG